jgi:hypothetical protein
MLLIGKMHDDVTHRLLDIPGCPSRAGKPDPCACGYDVIEIHSCEENGLPTAKERRAE